MNKTGATTVKYRAVLADGSEQIIGALYQLFHFTREGAEKQRKQIIRLGQSALERSTTAVAMNVYIDDEILVLKKEIDHG